MPRNLDMGLFFWKNLARVQNIYWKALAYEACHHMCTPLHMPTTLERCKKSMHCLIQKASRCAADCMSKTIMLFIFHFLYNTKIFGENHVYLFFISLFQWWKLYYIFIFFTYIKKELKRNMNDGTIIFLTSLLIILTRKILLLFSFWYKIISCFK